MSNYLKMGVKAALRLERDIRLIPQIPSVVNGDTYWPEKKRKKKENRLFDNLRWLFNYHEVNQFYNLYGLDIVGAKSDDYCSYIGFMNSRNQRNQMEETRKCIQLYYA